MDMVFFSFDYRLGLSSTFTFDVHRSLFITIISVPFLEYLGWLPPL